MLVWYLLQDLPRATVTPFDLPLVFHPSPFPASNSPLDENSPIADIPAYALDRRIPGCLAQTTNAPPPGPRWSTLARRTFPEWACPINNTSPAIGQRRRSGVDADEGRRRRRGAPANCAESLPTLVVRRRVPCFGCRRPVIRVALPPPLLQTRVSSAAALSFASVSPDLCPPCSSRQSFTAY